MLPICWVAAARGNRTACGGEKLPFLTQVPECPSPRGSTGPACPVQNGDEAQVFSDAVLPPRGTLVSPPGTILLSLDLVLGIIPPYFSR